MRKTKPKKVKPSPKAVIKSLKEQRDALQRRIDLGMQQNGELRIQLETANKRITLIAAENEELRTDRKWLKSLVQQLINPNGGQPPVTVTGRWSSNR